jgi:hypothetical protein
MANSAAFSSESAGYAHRRHQAASSQGNASLKLLTRNEGRAIEVLRMKSRKSNSRVSALVAAYVWFGYLLLQPGWVFSQVPFYQENYHRHQRPGTGRNRRHEAEGPLALSQETHPWAAKPTA